MQHFVVCPALFLSSVFPPFRVLFSPYLTGIKKPEYDQQCSHSSEEVLTKNSRAARFLLASFLLPTSYWFAQYIVLLDFSTMPGLRQLFFSFYLKFVLLLKGLYEPVSYMQEETQTIVSISSTSRCSNMEKENRHPHEKREAYCFSLLRSTLLSPLTPLPLLYISKGNKTISYQIPNAKG